MHKFEGEYGENNCNIKLVGKEPYFLINLEKYCHCKNVSGLSHCDFIYTIFDGDKIKIFIVELKNVNNIQKEKIKDILNDVINNKFPQTLNFLLNNNIVSFFCDKNDKNVEYNCILVLPHSVLALALIKRLKINYTKSFKSMGVNVNDVRISQCGGSIWEGIRN